jgi:tripartite-type tricarboxylate transporter receptor subunit TctC
MKKTLEGIGVLLTGRLISFGFSDGAKEENAMYRWKKTLLLSLLFVCVILMLTGPFAQAQSQEKYPVRAIDIIVPFVPGGGSDLFARLVADSLKKRWDVSVNVICKPGGQCVPANLVVYKAELDQLTGGSTSGPTISLKGASRR